MFIVLLILASIGALVDHKYIKAGGRRSSLQERRLFVIAIGITALTLIAFVLFGSPPQAVGDVAFFMAAVLFFLWEIGRFRVRRANPIRIGIEAKSESKESESLEYE